MESMIKLPQKQVLHYGMKPYILNAKLLGLKIEEPKMPNFWSENIRDGQTKQQLAQASK